MHTLILLNNLATENTIVLLMFYDTRKYAIILTQIHNISNKDIELNGILCSRNNLRTLYVHHLHYESNTTLFDVKLSFLSKVKLKYSK